jgi:hypothetical protein
VDDWQSVTVDVVHLKTGIAPLRVEIGGQVLRTLSRQARGVESAKESNAMTNITTPSSIALMPGLEAAWQDVDSSFDRF